MWFPTHVVTKASLIHIDSRLLSGPLISGQRYRHGRLGQHVKAACHVGVHILVNPTHYRPSTWSTCSRTRHVVAHALRTSRGRRCLLLTWVRHSGKWWKRSVPAAAFPAVRWAAPPPLSGGRRATLPAATMRLLHIGPRHCRLLISSVLLSALHCFSLLRRLPCCTVSFLRNIISVMFFFKHSCFHAFLTCILHPQLVCAVVARLSDAASVHNSQRRASLGSRVGSSESQLLGAFQKVSHIRHWVTHSFLLSNYKTLTNLIAKRHAFTLRQPPFCKKVSSGFFFGSCVLCTVGEISQSMVRYLLPPSPVRN